MQMHCLWKWCQWWCWLYCSTAKSKARLNNWSQLAWKRKEGLHVQQQGEVLCQTCRCICWDPKRAWLSLEIMLSSSSRGFRAWERLAVGIRVVFLTDQMSLYNHLVCSLALWIFSAAKWRVSTDIRQISSPFLFYCLQAQLQNAVSQSCALRDQSSRIQNMHVCHRTFKHNENEKAACFQFSNATSLWKIVSILLTWDKVQQAAAAQQLMSLHSCAEASRVFTWTADLLQTCLQNSEAKKVPPYVWWKVDTLQL